MTEQKVFSGEGVLFKQEYEYDKAGNLLQKTDSLFGRDRFRYDPVGRLITHFDPAGDVRRYLHDPAGDLLQTQASGEGEAWRRTGEYDSVRYTFDRVGNLIERTAPQGAAGFLWDANGRLIGSISNGKKTTYQDPLGRRISKETEGVVTRFYWDGDALLGDVTDDRQREWVYYPGGFEPLAMVENSYADKDNTATERIYYYANDPNGCPTRLLDESGKVVWAARYSAWGKVQQPSIFATNRKYLVDEVDQPLRLQGQYFDAETGLHYNRLRYYEPRIGAFVSQDPLGLAAGENVYGFGPNVQGWIDPLGLSCYKYKFDDSAGRFRDAKTGRFVSTTTVGKSLETKPNEAFFWSGRTNGIGGDLNARKIAESRGGVTLEKLLEDRGIKMPAWDETNPISTKAWKDISGGYASQVSGKVRGVIGEQLRPDAVWTKDELPKLLTNSNVTEITTIDPATLVEKTIFKR